MLDEKLRKHLLWTFDRRSIIFNDEIYQFSARVDKEFNGGIDCEQRVWKLYLDYKKDLMKVQLNLNLMRNLANSVGESKHAGNVQELFLNQISELQERVIQLQKKENSIWAISPEISKLGFNFSEYYDFSLTTEKIETFLNFSYQPTVEALEVAVSTHLDTSLQEMLILTPEECNKYDQLIGGVVSL